MSPVPLIEGPLQLLILLQAVNFLGHMEDRT